MALKAEYQAAARAADFLSRIRDEKSIRINTYMTSLYLLSSNSCNICSWGVPQIDASPPLLGPVMDSTTIGGRLRDEGGLTDLLPLEGWVAGVTEHGDIALSLQSNGGGEAKNYSAQFVCSASDAMSIAKTLVRIVAMADGEVVAWPPKRQWTSEE